MKIWHLTRGGRSMPPYIKHWVFFIMLTPVLTWGLNFLILSKRFLTSVYMLSILKRKKKRKCLVASEIWTCVLCSCGEHFTMTLPHQFLTKLLQTRTSTVTCVNYIYFWFIWIWHQFEISASPLVSDSRIHSESSVFPRIPGNPLRLSSNPSNLR